MEFSEQNIYLSGRKVGSGRKSWVHIQKYDWKVENGLF